MWRLPADFDQVNPRASHYVNVPHAGIETWRDDWLRLDVRHSLFLIEVRLSAAAPPIWMHGRNTMIQAASELIASKAYTS
jgi:hypothetical protein